ncbi:MAG: exodeoxyribonuclease VII large subunit [Flavobacteriales bacterium]|nr:exodeoxyribonuclease VII large subunit [Flavobacteriales bacterium]MCX7768963.1 exodeoxyribonuclease VII large subunit [Flavobacteriales bacterium]MDW8410800.1 exodeoxyribonuclease VII large subunit [Flavobacteriales bacterium]
MPEQIGQRKVYTLLEVAECLRVSMENLFPQALWIRAEMLKVNYYPHSGHCYPDLVEKRNDQVVAQMRAHIWNSDFQDIQRRFREVVGAPLQDGIKILFLGQPVYHPRYGLSLRILDIDPHYTLGDLERERRQTLARLRAEGLLDRNKRLPIPLLPRRLAIISVRTSRGYADFMKVLDAVQDRFQIFTMLFPALLQGEAAVDQIRRRLEQIAAVAHHFDAVAIIRGGGGEAGLSCYNNYDLARAVATFPLPVFTGIGHATNETVVEMVAAYNAITPTQLAHFIVERFVEAEEALNQAQTLLMQHVPRLLKDLKRFLRDNITTLTRTVRETGRSQHVLLQRYSLRLVRRTGHLLAQHRASRGRLFMLLRQGALKVIWAQRYHVDIYTKTIDREVRILKHDLHRSLADCMPRVIRQATELLRRQRKELMALERNVHNLSPEQVLRRGYSITLHRGKALKDPQQVSAGETLETLVYLGKVLSIVQSSETISHDE